MIQKGDKLKCVFNQLLPGNDKGPDLELNKEYLCKDVYLDAKGNPHIDVGLPMRYEFVRSYATGQELPYHTHFCHPNRFVIVKD